MTRRALTRLLFMIYCVTAGTFLLMLPWSPYWDLQLASLPALSLQALALGPWLRGAVSGFGLVHLLWGAHDLDVWLLERERSRRR